MVVILLIWFYVVLLRGQIKLPGVLGDGLKKLDLFLDTVAAVINDSIKKLSGGIGAGFGGKGGAPPTPTRAPPVPSSAKPGGK